MITTIVTQIGSYLPVGVPVLVALVGGYFMLRARRTSPGAEPTAIKDVWEENRLTQGEIDRERKWRRRLEAYIFELLYIFRNYVARVQAGGSTALTPHERVFHDAEPPSGEINVTPQV